MMLNYTAAVFDSGRSLLQSAAEADSCLKPDDDQVQQGSREGIVDA